MHYAIMQNSMQSFIYYQFQNFMHSIFILSKGFYSVYHCLLQGVREDIILCFVSFMAQFYDREDLSTCSSGYATNNNEIL